MTGLDLITDALRELTVISAADVPSADDAALGLVRLNRLLDTWNAQRDAVYADAMARYALVAGLSPHTMGPATSTPTWTVTSRPVDVTAVAVVLTGGQRRPLQVHLGLDGWAMLSDPSTTGTLPTDVWYVSDWPLASFYFYPVPSTALFVEVYSRIVLAALDLTTTITLPPGYQTALTLTLTEDLAAPFNATVAPMTLRNAAQARARIFAANRRPPRIATQDAGMPGGPRRGFDYLSGGTGTAPGWVDTGLV